MRPRPHKPQLVGQLDSPKLFLETMQRFREELMQKARDSHVAWRDSAQFFLLKEGVKKIPQKRQVAGSKQPTLPERKESHESKGVKQIRTVGRILESAERLDVCAQCEQSLSDLICLVETGDTLLVGTLHAVAVKAVGALNSIAANKPQIVRSLARNQFSWPALIGRKRLIKQINERLIKHIQLGEGEIFSRREWQLSAPSTQAALDLFLTAKMYRDDWNLPPLTEENKRQWFEIAWKKMLEEGILPEEIPWLAIVGKSAKGKRSVTRGMSEQTEGMKRDDVRAEIKRQVRNAFEKLVAGASENSK